MLGLHRGTWEFVGCRAHVPINTGFGAGQHYVACLGPSFSTT